MNGMHGLLFSCGGGDDLRQLTRYRVAGAIPFAGHYRVVDFMLSGMVNAGIRDVGVLLDGRCQSMLDHLGTGRVWDLRSSHGGLKVLPSFAYGGSGQFPGRMEALSRVRGYLREIRQEYVVLSDSSLIANLPLRQVLSQHIATGADITAVCTTQPAHSDRRFHVDETGRIVDREQFEVQGLNVFVLSTARLMALVEEWAARGENGFRSLLRRLHLHAFVWQGYARCIRSVGGYYRSSMELLQGDVRAELFDPRHPILGRDRGGPSSYVDPDGACVDTLLSDGCNIQGSVSHCVISDGVTVAGGAQVESCVLLEGTVVGSGAVLRHVIADKNVTIGRGQRLLGSGDNPIVLEKDSMV